MSLAHQMELSVEVEASGVLDMTAIDHEGERNDVPWRCGCELNPARGFE